MESEKLTPYPSKTWGSYSTYKAERDSRPIYIPKYKPIALNGKKRNRGGQRKPGVLSKLFKSRSNRKYRKLGRRPRKIYKYKLVVPSNYREI